MKMIPRCQKGKDLAPDAPEPAADQMLHNRAFRSIVNEMSLHKMVHVDEKLVDQSVTQFRKLTQGRSVEKAVNAEGKKAVTFEHPV